MIRVMCCLLMASPARLAAQDTSLPLEIPGAPPATYADPRGAAARLERLSAADSLNGELAWRAAVALVSAAQGVPGDTLVPDRAALFQRAAAHAHRAVVLAPDQAHAHFALALALGRASLTQGGRERVRAAARIRAAAQRALELDPGHDGAWHVLGRWHAEVRRLSGTRRFLARTFLGGRVLGEASWEAAIRYLEQAVALRPDWIIHRLDLAEVLMERGFKGRARAELAAIGQLPARDVLDPEYQARAEAMLAAMPPQAGGT